MLEITVTILSAYHIIALVVILYYEGLLNLHVEFIFVSYSVLAFVEGALTPTKDRLTSTSSKTMQMELVEAKKRGKSPPHCRSAAATFGRTPDEGGLSSSTFKLCWQQ